MGYWIESQRARFAGAPLLAITITALAACGGGSTPNATTSTEPVQATTTEPPFTDGPPGQAANAPYWAWELTNRDPDLKQFADYYAAEFCKKDQRHYLSEVSSQSLAYEYAFYRNKIGKPIDMPEWADDAEVKSTLGLYMVSTYCPVKSTP